MQFLAAFLAKLLQPLIDQAVAAAFAKFTEYQKAQEDARIDKAVTDANNATTDEERIKAAREMAEANRHL